MSSPRSARSILDVSITQGEAEIQPDGVLDDLGREAVAAVAERSHADILSDTPLAPDPVSVTMPDRMPDAMGVRRQTVEHPFGTLKAWMGATHFLTRTLDKVRTEMSLHVLAYNVKRMIAIFGIAPLLQAI